MTSREEFLERVRNALGDQPAVPVPPDVPDDLLRLASTDEDLLERFEHEAVAVGMEVERVKDPASGVVAFLKRESVSTVALGVEDDDLRARVRQGLHDAGIEIVEDLFACDAGVTDVHAALAETGTLVLHPGANQSRGVSLAPMLHVAIADTARVLPDMIDYVANCDAGERGARILVTGPSKTADIEGELVCGVHGPGRVRILLVG